MANPEACPLSKLLRASHTVTGQDQCMVHAHGVCALGALVCLFVSVSTQLGLLRSSYAYIWFKEGGSCEQTSVSSLYVQKRSPRSSKKLLF